jgi:type I restriction enzyme S subunit
VVGGGTPSKANPEFWKGAIPWVSPKDMKTLKIHDSEDHISEGALAASATRQIPRGSVLVVARSGILAHTLPVAVSMREVTVNQDIKAIVPHGEMYDPFYVAYALKGLASGVLERCMKKGATVQSLEMDRFLAESLPFPFSPEPSKSLHAQRRIVARIDELLAEVREARRLLGEMVRDIDWLLPAAFEELIRDLESPARTLPLADVATAFNGRASGEGTSPVRVFKTKHVHPHALRMGRPSLAKAEQVAKYPPDRFLRPGDVLMANIAEGTLGRVTYVAAAEDNWTVDTQIMILRSLDEGRLLGKWLYYYLWSARGQQEILSRRSGIAFADKRGQTHIYPKNVLEIPVPVPSIDRQREAVAMLDSIQQQAAEARQLLGQKSTLLDHVEQSILERAFRGEL